MRSKRHFRLLHLHRSRLIMASILVVTTVVLVWATVWIMSREIVKKPVVNDILPAKKVASSAIVLATRDDTVVVERSDASDREKTYLLSSIDSNLEISNMGSIQANIFVTPLAVRGAFVYFVNPEGELARYNLTMKNVERVGLFGIRPVFGYLGDQSMRDFLLVGSKLLYLRGVCQEGRLCDLLLYDLKTRKNTLLVKHVERLMSHNGLASVNLHTYVPNERILLMASWGDGAATGSDIYEYSLNMKKATKVDSAIWSAEGPHDTRLSDLRARSITCGDLTADQRMTTIGTGNTMQEEMRTSVTAGKQSKLFYPTSIAGCK